MSTTGATSFLNFVTYRSSNGSWRPVKAWNKPREMRKRRFRIELNLIGATIANFQKQSKSFRLELHFLPATPPRSSMCWELFSINAMRDIFWRWSNVASSTSSFNASPMAAIINVSIAICQRWAFSLLQNIETWEFPVKAGANKVSFQCMKWRKQIKSNCLQGEAPLKLLSRFKPCYRKLNSFNFRFENAQWLKYQKFYFIWPCFDRGVKEA